MGKAFVGYLDLGLRIRNRKLKKCDPRLLRLMCIQLDRHTRPTPRIKLTELLSSSPKYLLSPSRDETKWCSGSIVYRECLFRQTPAEENRELAIGGDVCTTPTKRLGSNPPPFPLVTGYGGLGGADLAGVALISSQGSDVAPTIATSSSEGQVGLRDHRLCTVCARM